MKTISCKIKNISGKGLGMVATKVISKWELILEEKPVLDSSLKLSLQKQFEYLSATEQKSIKSLKNIYPEEDILTGILNTNAFEREDPDGSILCVKLSRFNHSCMPNVAWIFNGECSRAVAMRDIAKGEELCISYCLLADEMAQIRSELLLNYKFYCMCELCDSENDIKRKRIIANRVAYGNLDQRVYHSEIHDPFIHLELVKKLFKAMELGKIMFPDMIERAAYYGFQMALVCRNRSEAVKYIKQAYEANVIAEGEDAEGTKELLYYANNPEKHVLFWGW